jgi:hypothetical protein
MLIPDHTGHSTLQWAVGDATSVAAAHERFEALSAQCLKPFQRTAHQEYAPMPAFDPTADEILWVRPLQGG